MSHIKAVLFDKDGTLFDFHATWGEWCKNLLLENSGGDAELATQMGQAIGYNVTSGVFSKDSIVIAHTPTEIAAVLLPFFPDETLNNLTARLNDAAATAPLVQAVELRPFLQGLIDQDIILGVATNDGEAPAKAHLLTEGINDIFEFIAGSDSGFGCKPETGMMQAFLAQIGLKPDQVAMVGDSVHDLVAGRAAGMICIAVLTGVATKQDLLPYADVVFDDIGHIPDWL